ncbi:RNA polymerase sigma factor SigL [Planctomycetes bacterium Poly30]|uniref:RNA polymerase sigma factor SigL n=1 Tax=Saltatorellus ferox TaxID=2528018 RepID=A0A518EKD2_9BACT|nr:RNA polymerase sigma factor SigL [Planctomycetes bacterium Poly30]
MPNHHIHDLLAEVSSTGKPSTKLMEVLYSELRRMAEQLMVRERGSHTLQPTALVHEAFLRLVDAEKAGEEGHLHFLSAAAVTMRRVLVDHARTVGAEKRGGHASRKRVTLGGIVDEDPEEDLDLALLEEALVQLEAASPRHGKIVELRFFAGMSGAQIAEHLGVSRNTVVRDLTFSRAWLKRWMEERESAGL